MLITLVSASLLGLLLVYLSIGVTNARGRKNSGDCDEDTLQNAIRAHGNFTEYAPMALILIGLLEYTGANVYLTIGISAAFVVGRFMHGLTFGKFEGANPFRYWGTVLTFLSILVAAIAGLVEAYFML